MKRNKIFTLTVSGLLLSGCGGGGGGGSDTSSDTVNITGTVPGTRIEAFADNGAYYATESVDNGTVSHPFRLAVPPRMGLRLVMITGAATADEVVAPIGFRGNDGMLHTRLLLGGCTQADLGHVPVPLGRNEAAPFDADGDGVLDAPFVLDDMGARNPLAQCDTDGDGMNDWDDPDHGGSHYGPGITDPMDQDGDGVPNRYDADFTPAPGDSDGDGLPDEFDSNPDNRPDGNHRLVDDFNGDGYMDDDANHDGFHDDGGSQHGGPMM